MTHPNLRPQTLQRLSLVAVGAAAGGALYLLTEALSAGWLPDRVLLALAVAALVFFAALLGMAGPLPLRRAALRAAPLALLVAALMSWAGLRYPFAADLAGEAIPVLAGLALTFLPLPFLIAAEGGNWRHYPTLFVQAWGTVIRQAAAWLFVALVWLVFLLSHQLLKMVGVPVLGHLVDAPVFVALFTGAMLGLGIAVIHEMSGVVAPDLLIRLLRLFLPPLLIVLGVFLAALPFRGFEGLFRDLSAATILLFCAGFGVMLVTAAAERSDSLATQSPLIVLSARLMAGVTIFPAWLGVWAVWLRVAQYGWTPERLLALCGAILCLGYGALYLLAAFRRTGWQDRVRQANLIMALVVMAVAALLLSPVVNPERIAANSQIARLDRGEVSPEGFDFASVSRWGRPGDEAMATLRARQDNPALMAALARWDGTPDPVLEAARRADMAAMLPLRPAGQTAIRAAILASLPDHELSTLREACSLQIQGRPGCALVVADFLTDLPGAEALLLRAVPLSLRAARGDRFRLHLAGYALRDGQVQPVDTRLIEGRISAVEDPAALLAAMQDQDPVLQAVPVQMLQIGDRKMLLLP